MPFDAFLKIDGIPGESTAEKHKGEIEIESFSWGVSNSGSATHGGTWRGGRSSFSCASSHSSGTSCRSTLPQNSVRSTSPRPAPNAARTRFVTCSSP